MTDPIITIANALPATAGAIATIYGVAKPFLTKILGPAADEIGELGRDYIKDFRARNVAVRLANAEKLLNEAGIEPHPIPPKILVPLLEAASLEDNSFLSEQWDSLLANAANPHARAKIDNNLVDILKQLNYNQSIILIVLSVMLEKGNSNSSNEEKAGTILHTNLLLKNLFILNEANQEAFSEISDEEFYISLDNLARLRLCTLTGMDALDTTLIKAGDAKGAMLNMNLFNVPGRANISITYLGLAFIAACQTPQKLENISI